MKHFSGFFHSEVFYHFYLTSLHLQWYNLFVRQSPCFSLFPWCSEVRKHKANQSSETPKLDGLVAQCGGRSNMRVNGERVALRDVIADSL